MDRQVHEKNNIPAGPLCPTSSTSCCIELFPNDERQAETTFSIIEFCCLWDERTHDSSPAQLCRYTLCCPLIFCVYWGLGYFAASNYNAGAIASPSYAPTLHYPRYCSLCFDPRKWIIIRHFLFCGCGVYRGNSSTRGIGLTGLHAAAQYGYIQYAKLQLLYGDDIDAACDSSFVQRVPRTPLQLACINSRKDMIKLLVLRGANLNIRDGTNRTALHYACENNLQSSIRLMVSRGANLYDDVGDHPIERLPTSPTLNTTQSDFIEELLTLQGEELVREKINLSLLDAVNAGNIRMTATLLQENENENENKDREGVGIPSNSSSSFHAKARFDTGGTNTGSGAVLDVEMLKIATALRVAV